MDVLAGNESPAGQVAEFASHEDDAAGDDCQGCGRRADEQVEDGERAGGTRSDDRLDTG